MAKPRKEPAAAEVAAAGSSEDDWAPSTLAEAKANALIKFTGPSTSRFLIRPMTLTELAEVDGLPDDLIRIALLELVPGGVVAEIAHKLDKGDEAALAAAQKLSSDLAKLVDRLVLHSVISPALTEEDVAELDSFDREMIAAVAQRRIRVDAIGRRVNEDSTARFPDADLEPASVTAGAAGESEGLDVSEVQS